MPLRKSLTGQFQPDASIGSRNKIGRHTFFLLYIQSTTTYAHLPASAITSFITSLRIRFQGYQEYAE